MARATAHVRSFWKFFHFVNQFPRLARKNGHPVLFAILSRIFVITLSSHLKSLNVNYAFCELCRSVLQVCVNVNVNYMSHNHRLPTLQHVNVSITKMRF